MKVRTLNRVYTVDLTPGSNIQAHVSGHPELCPDPTLVVLFRPIEVGRSLIAAYTDGPKAGRKLLVTSPVQEILT
jgi:hypothetical protein